MSTTVLEHDGRPTVVAGGLAVTAALLAVVAIANSPRQLMAVAAEVVAVFALAAGAFISTAERGTGDGEDSIGTSAVVLVLYGIGVVAAIAASVLAVVNPVQMSSRLELLPGLLGVTVLTLGLLPVRRWTPRPRYLVGIGTVLLVIGVFTSGVVYGADAFALLVATALAVVAWDAGEQAISLGTHVGRHGETTTVSLVHVGASVLVGVVAVTAAWLLYTINVTGLPLLGLVAFLGAAILLAAALYA